MSGWIHEGNLQQVALYVSLLVGYEWGYFDTGPIEAGAAASNAHAPSWFAHAIEGITLSVARDHGNGMLQVVLSGEFDDVTEARLETMLFFN
ncbi:hypothetical protein ACFOWZ_20075 [Lentzea rhizosphaerae]|uniref:Uncharacterized protein n=1 Tax=Lentzea rhizosphaerae TaxID=2041025 RepID=A0ABV8BVS9_9PSEU